MHPFIRRLLVTASLGCLIANTSALAATGPMDFLFGGGMPPASERVIEGVQRIWKLGEFSALRLSATPGGAAANQQPAVLDPAAVQMALLAVQYESAPGVWKPLFVASDLQDISQSLAKALAVATPQDDVLLMASARYDGALLGLQRSVLARLFVSQGALNLVVKEARADLLASYRVSNTLPRYDFGDRQTASAVRIMAANATQVRPDWLALALGAKTAGAAGAPTDKAPVQPAATPPAVAPNPAVAPAPAPASVRDKAFYEQQSMRLEGLKALLDKGLISDAEYQHKRAEILQSL